MLVGLLLGADRTDPAALWALPWRDANAGAVEPLDGAVGRVAGDHLPEGHLMAQTVGGLLAVLGAIAVVQFVAREGRVGKAHAPARLAGR
jgi:hypothetical protein